MANNTDTSFSCLLCYKGADPLLGELIPKYSCHLLCLRFASGISEKEVFPEEKDFIKEVNRARKMKCKYCHKPRASLGCVDPKCKCSYHLGCAKENDTINIHDIFTSYCDKHRIIQTDDHPSFKFKGEKPCTICDKDIMLKDALTSPCCRKIYHRTCIQIKASTGQQSCPHCGDATTKFLNDMFYYGIYFKGFNNEKDYIKAGQTLPSPNIKKLLDQKARESFIKKSPSKKNKNKHRQS